MKATKSLLTSLLVAGLSFTQTTFAEDGVYSDRIVLGQSAAFEGPAAALGLGMRLGLQAAFNEANQKGGVYGRKIE